jgi:hypothetical protein
MDQKKHQRYILANSSDTPSLWSEVITMSESQEDDDLPQLKKLLQKCICLSENSCDQMTQSRLDRIILDLQERIRTWKDRHPNSE